MKQILSHPPPTHHPPTTAATCCGTGPWLAACSRASASRRAETAPLRANCSKVAEPPTTGNWPCEPTACEKPPGYCDEEEDEDEEDGVEEDDDDGKK